jgi:hypothetical protein
MVSCTGLLITCSKLFSGNHQFERKASERMSRDDTQNISHLQIFNSFEPVLCSASVSKLQKQQKSRYLLQFEDTIGDVPIFKMLNGEMNKMVDVNSSLDAKHSDKPITFKSYAQD